MLIDKKLELLKGQGIKVSPVEEKQYSFESKIEINNSGLILSAFFGKKGVKLTLQGNESSAVYREVKEVIFGDSFFNGTVQNYSEPESYIGTDESGKGDYFGPLIVAGVMVNTEILTKLKKIGVRDSKRLTGNQIENLAQKIMSMSEGKYDVVFISPEKYNQLYSRIKNVNRLLGWAHARVIENILMKNFAEQVISDKFGDEKIILGSLQEKGKQVKLRQETGAEKYTAVAAASVIARYRLNQWFDRISDSLGITVPKGASGKVDETARMLLKKIGKEELMKLVKFHFKTSKKIFN